MLSKLLQKYLLQNFISCFIFREWLPSPQFDLIKKEGRLFKLCFSYLDYIISCNSIDCINYAGVRSCKTFCFPNFLLQLNELSLIVYQKKIFLLLPCKLLKISIFNRGVVCANQIFINTQINEMRDRVCDTLRHKQGESNSESDWKVLIETCMRHWS